MSDKEQEWQVQKILQRGKFNNVIHYLVLWKGYQLSEATWEPISNLKNCEDAIVQFQCILNLQKKPKSNSKNRKKLKVQNIFHNEITKFVNCLKLEGNQDASQQQQKQQIKPPFNQNQPELIIHDHFQKEKNTLSLMNQTQQRQETLDKSLHIPQSSQINIKDTIQTGFKRNRLVIYQEQQQNFMEGKIQKKRKVNQPQQYSQNLIKDNITKDFIKEEQYIEQKRLDPVQQNQNLEGSKIKTSQPIIENIIYKHNHLSYNQDIINNNQDFIKQNNTIPLDKSQENITPLQKIFNLHNNSSDNNIKSIVQEDIQSQLRLSKQKTKEEKHPKEQLFVLKNINLERYHFLDALYQQNQKIYVYNVIRKMEGKKRLKIKANMIDLSKKPQFIRILGSLRFIEEETALQKIEYLIKQEYGWLAIGKHLDLGNVIVDVNLLEQNNWQVVVQMMEKKDEDV